MANKNQGYDGQRGNAFFMILMAIVLFAALAFTFSRGAQQGGENISNRQAELAAADVVTYAQKIERGVQLVMSRGLSENDISFDSEADPAYNNTECSDNQASNPDDYLRCEKGKVFASTGAKLTWQAPPSDINNGQNYFIGLNQVGPVTETADPKSLDLVMLLPVKPRVCTEINKITSRAETWRSAGTLNSATKFTGDFENPSGVRIDWPDVDPKARPSGCFCKGASPCASTDPHYFYHVLYAR